MNDAGASRSVSLRMGIVRWLSIVLQSGIGLIFLLTAASKAAAPASIYATIKHLYEALQPTAVIARTIDQQRIIVAALSFLLVLEIALGVLLIARWRPRLTLGIVIGALFVFSAALVALILDESAPSCGCTGAIRLATKARTGNIIGLGRNLLLIAACVWLRERAASKPFHP